MSVCVCVCVGENEKGRKESMGEQDVATETGGDLSALSKHRTTGHTLMLGMDSQTIVCLIILCLLRWLVILLHYSGCMNSLRSQRD